MEVRVNSPLNYLGGKSRLAAKIVPLIPEHTCYVEPFCGAAWVLFSKEPSHVEILNDGDGELVTFWRVIQNHLHPFLDFYRHAVTSRRLFDIEMKRDPKTLTDIQRACRYFYLQRHAFGGKTVGRTFGTSAMSPGRLGLTDLEERLLEIHWRLAPPRVTIENLDAVDCLQRYDRPTTFAYIDPPYWETSGYAVPFGEPDFKRLRQALDTLKGKFLLSMNDVPATRALFAGFQIRAVRTSYTVGNGRQAAAGRATSRLEILVSNY